MQRASQAIEQHPGELTKNKVAKEAGGKKQATLAAIDVLRDEGYVTTTRGRSGHDVYESVRSVPREGRPAVGSICQPWGTPLTPNEWFLVPGSYTGEPGNQFQQVLGNRREPLGTTF